MVAVEEESEVGVLWEGAAEAPTAEAVRVMAVTAKDEGVEVRLGVVRKEEVATAMAVAVARKKAVAMVAEPAEEPMVKVQSVQTATASDHLLLNSDKPPLPAGGVPEDSTRSIATGLMNLRCRRHQSHCCARKCLARCLEPPW